MRVLSKQIGRKLSRNLAVPIGTGAGLPNYPEGLLLGRWTADQIPIISGSVVNNIIQPGAVVDLGPLLGAAGNKDNCTGSGNFEFFDEAPSGIFYDPSNPTHWTVNFEDLSFAEYENRVRNDFTGRVFVELEYRGDGVFLGLSEILYYGELDGANNPIINSLLSQPVDVNGAKRYIGTIDDQLGPELITNGDFSDGLNGYGIISTPPRSEVLAVPGGARFLSSDFTYAEISQNPGYVVGDAYVIEYIADDAVGRVKIADQNIPMIGDGNLNRIEYIPERVTLNIARATSGYDVTISYISSRKFFKNYYKNQPLT